MPIDQRLDAYASALSRLPRRLRLGLDLGLAPSSRAAKAMLSFAEALVQASGELLALAHEPTGTDDGPSLSFENVRYHALPAALELQPFIDLLTGVAVRAARVFAERATSAPAHRLDVLIAPTCPNCPSAVRACAEVALARPEIQLRVIDVLAAAELASTFRSVPTVILDGDFTWVGPLSASDIVAAVTSQHRAEFSLRALHTMLDAGRIDSLVERLLADPDALPLIADVFRHGTLQQRITLMLVAEQALSTQPNGLDGAVPLLFPLLELPDATVRGDTADLLGKIGAPAAREPLSRLVHDEHPDVAEAAREALESLRTPS